MAPAERHLRPRVEAHVVHRPPVAFMVMFMVVPFGAVAGVSNTGLGVHNTGLGVSHIGLGVSSTDLGVSNNDLGVSSTHLSSSDTLVTTPTWKSGLVSSPPSSDRTIISSFTCPMQVNDETHVFDTPRPVLDTPPRVLDTPGAHRRGGQRSRA